MTLGDGIRKVYMLLDEYSSGGVVTVDPDIEKKMADFFDIAQKDVAGYKRIIKEQTITLESTADVYPLPGDLSKIFRVWIGGELTNRYVQLPGGISFPGTVSGTRSTAITLDSMTSTYLLPSDFLRVVKVLRDGAETEDYTLSNGAIIFADAATGAAEETITLDSMKIFYPLPSDFLRVVKVLHNGVEIQNYELIGGNIEFPGVSGGTVTLQYAAKVGVVTVEYVAKVGTAKVEYFAVPATITPQTPESYVFEVCEEAANCMPFFVAAQNLMPDLVVDYSAFLQQYYQMRGALDVTLPEGDGSGGALRQTMFR